MVAGVLGVLGAARAARGQGTQPVAVVPAPVPPPPPNAPPPDDLVPRLDQRTALALDAGELKLGVLAFDYSITDRLSVGIDPPFWLVRAFATVLVPNLHLKLVAIRTKDLWVSGTVAGYYAFIGGDANTTGQLLTVPLSLFVSYRPLPRFWIHPELNYTFANAFGTGDFTKFTLGGTASARAGQAGLMLQYELTEVVSLTLLGRVQFYTGAIAVTGSGSIDEFTTATVDMRVAPALQHPWMVVPGVALLWQHLRITVGVGYGNYFLPGMDVPLRGAGFVPDGSLYVVL